MKTISVKTGWLLNLALILAMLLAALPAQDASAAGAVSLTTLGAAYTQDFNTLANSGTSSTVPTGWDFNESGTNANTTYTAGTGSSNTGDSYSFGAANDSERAFGGLLSGSLTPTIGAQFTNNTGTPITQLAISYTGEQWRLGTTGRADRIDFQLSSDATSLTTGTWTDYDSLDFTSPTTGPTVGLLDGNAAANRNGISFTIMGLSIANGSSFWIRWADFNASGADDGLSVDDFSLIPDTSPVPTNPSGIGVANPDPVTAGSSTLLTVTVTPGINPTSTGLTVIGDLSTIGGSAAQPLFDDGTNGDVTLGDNVFSFLASVPVATATGAKSLPITIADAQARSGNATIALTVQPVVIPPADVTISQVYGGGGNSGATYTHDFIELYNRSGSPVNITGWSVQYASSSGTSWQVTLLSGSLAPGQYYLIQEAQGSGGTTPLPTPDAVGTIAMSATAGKVALVNNSTALSGSCPTGANIVDFVGYGGANCFEGAGQAPTLSNTTAALRAGNGATDTNNNAADFAAGAPNPRNSSFGFDAAPSVSSSVPANDAVNVPVIENIVINFNEPVNVTGNWYSILCTSGSRTATVSGGPTSFTLDPDTDFAYNESCTVTILAAQVTDQDSDDPPDNMVSDYSFTFLTEGVNVCALAFTPAYAIQGSGLAAAITGPVTTQGVVVGDFEGTAAASGFYLQDLTGEGDATTSDGIFVYTGNSDLVSMGQVVRVTGYARERFNQTTINGSNSNSAAVPAANIINCGTGSVAATDVTLPFADANFPERYEGMLVRFPQALVIAEYFNYDRFGEIVLAQPLAGETRPFTGTAIDEPGAPANARTAANALSRITLDDAQSAQNPPTLRHPNGQPFSLENRFRGDDTVQNAVGVLGFDFSLYRIVPTGPADYTAANPRPASPEPVGGTVRVAAMNTLNYFVTLDPLDDPTTPDNPADNICGPTGTEHDCRGADLSQPDEFTRQRDKLLQALAGLDADIIGLNELENTLNVEPLADIVAGLPGYAYIDTGVIGTDAIKVGLIYRPAAVTPFGAYQILDSTDDPRFIDTKSRPSLAQTFEVNATGARFTVVVNHLKSKGSACDDVGDPDLGDGQGNCSQTRRAAAEALVDWLATDPTGSGDPDFLITGDLNSYAQEDTIDEIKAGSDDVAGTGDDFTNLITHFQGAYAYSYTFDGQAGYLDYALANASLFAQLTGAADWHINSDEPDVLDYDTSFKPAEQEVLYEVNAFRTSDHDPVVVGLDGVPTLDKLEALVNYYDANGDITGNNTTRILLNRLARARHFLERGQMVAYRAQLLTFIIQVRGFTPKFITQAASDSLVRETRLLLMQR